MKTKFSRKNEEIHISRQGWKELAFTTYRSDYYEELTTHEWYLKDGYPTNKSLGGGLHRYIMRKWYTDEVFDEFDKKGYIVEHLNNNHMDARISNLEFIKKSYNTAKGQTLDVDSKKLSHRIALRHHRTILTVQMRRQKFRQMRQNFACVVGATQRNFVKYDGIYASRCAVKT